MARRKAYIAKSKAAATPMAVHKESAFKEIGTSGLTRSSWRGQVDEEFVRDLQGSRGLQTYREMKDNDAVIGAFLFGIEMIVRNVKWRVEGSEENKRAFVESNFQDMSHSFDSLISDSLSMLPYGFSWFATVYKRRLGENRDPSKRSRFNDGFIGWRKIAPRAQTSLSEWRWDEEGGIQAFVQSAPPDYKEVVIPITRSLLFRLGPYGGNPEGRSILRSAYRSWFFKKKIEDIESIGVERDLAGLPVMYASPRIQASYKAELENIVRNIKNDEQMGALLPLLYDEHGNVEIKLELLSSAGTRAMDTNAIIQRLEQAIARTVLADFLMLGQSTGSWALSSDKTDIFALALGAILQAIAEVFNRHAIPRLLQINGWDLEDLPQLVPGDVKAPNLQEWAAFLTAASGAGMPLFPDPDLENLLRQAAHWPDKPEGEGASKPQAKPQVSRPSSNDAEEDAEDAVEDGEEST